MSQPLIELRGVSKSFRLPTVRRETVREHVFGMLQRRPFETLNVLRDVNLEVRRGETFGIMGRNGCGKSTLLKIICGIYQADSGTVAVRAPITPLLELGIGWHPDLDAIDNILVLSTIMGMSLREARASVDEVLAFAGLEQFANQRVRHFSSGMASRLAYSVAFKAVRDILIIDEIFAVGDAGFKAQCEERYRELMVEGCTVIMVSHDPQAITSHCDHAVLLEQGQIAMHGSGTDIVNAYLDTASDGQAVGAGSI
jgi:ABC-type polysaccharide/polyol phosphate transport system ATPase subunit